MHFDIQQLVDSPQEEFIPNAFLSILGRMPDVIGVAYYANRMRQYASKELIIAELITSSESIVSPKDNKKIAALIRRYHLIRNLPLGKNRWKFLPALERKKENTDFNWNNWAVKYLEGTQVDAGEKNAEQETSTFGLEQMNKLSETVDGLNLRINRLSDELEYLLCNPPWENLKNLRISEKQENVSIPVSIEVAGVFFQLQKNHKRYS